MCYAFSCIVLKNRKVVWKFGMDSHEDLILLCSGLKDDTVIPEKMTFARCEYSPENKSYLYPNRWIFKLDESIKPSWFDKICEASVEKEWIEWKKKLDEILIYKEIIHPFKIIPPKITDQHIQLLCQWNSVQNFVWNSVQNSVRKFIGDSIWNSVWLSVWLPIGESVRNSILDSMQNSVKDFVQYFVWKFIRDFIWAYTGSFFKLPRSQWLCTEGIESEDYPFVSAVKLWEMGLVPSYDGKIWRLHGGENAKILWEGKINTETK